MPNVSCIITIVMLYDPYLGEVRGFIFYAGLLV